MLEAKICRAVEKMCTIHYEGGTPVMRTKLPKDMVTEVVAEIMEATDRAYRPFGYFLTEPGEAYERWKSTGCPC